jgi:hypothetical protein
MGMPIITRSMKWMAACALGLLLQLCLISSGIAASSPIGDPSVAKCVAQQPPLDPGSDPGFPGKWWDPNHYGTGWDFYFVDTNPSAIEVIWLTFDANHRPIWLTNGGGATMQQNPNGTKEFWGTLYQVNVAPGTWAQTNTGVGSFAVTFAAGSTDTAAVNWQWNAAGSTIRKDQCIYNYFYGANTGPAGGAAGVNQGYTGNWYNTAFSGWGLDVNVGVTPSLTTEIDNPVIFDSAGNPTWLRGKTTSPTTAQTSVSLDYWSGNIPTTVCSTSSCIAKCTAVGSLVRSFSDTQNGSASITANVNSGTSGGCTTPATAIAWPNSPLTNPAAILKLTDLNIVAVNQTTCSIPSGQTTCSITVSWASSWPNALVFRRDLTDNTISSSSISPNSNGQKVEQLAAGSDVQYELYKNGVPTGSPLYVSAEVIIPAAQGTVTPISQAPKVATTPQTDATSDKVGATVAEFRVDEGGNSTYSVPIQIPPGTAGVTPKLALRYNSRLPNGVMGPGWAIDGSSSITRCRQAREDGDFMNGATPIDGNPSPVNFTTTDRFCLDGVRLLLSSGTYGTDGSIYSPENDPATRVTATVTNSTAGPDSFAVQRKDGTTSTYGYTSATSANNARVTGTLSSATVYVAWSLARTQDSSGNYVDFVYIQQPAAGTYAFAAGASEAVLSQVKYAGHATTPVSSPYATVAFNYTTLPIGSVRLGYQSGVAMVQTQQLASVSVTDASHASNSALRYYKLTYQTSASGSGFAEVSQITECRDSTMAVCFPPTTFTWAGATTRQISEGTQTISGLNLAALVGYKVADIDGDGRQDFAFAVNDNACGSGKSSIYVGFLDQTAAHQMTLVTTTTPGSQAPVCATIDLTNNDQAWALLDYDGDGRADLMIGGAAGAAWKIYPSTGRPTAGARAFDITQDRLSTGTRAVTTPINGPSCYTDFNGARICPNAAAIIADLNGDGLPDVIYPSPNYTSGSGAVSARLMSRQSDGTYKFSEPYTVTLADPSGIDLAISSVDPTCSTGSFANFAYCNFNFFQNDPAHRPAVASDINGDGRADLTLLITAVGSSKQAPASATGSIYFDPSSGSGGPNRQSYWYQFTSGNYVANNGDPLNGGTLTLAFYQQLATKSAGGSLPGGGAGLFVVDLNGDGLADILYQDPNDTSGQTFHAQLNTGNGYSSALTVTGITNSKYLQLVDINGDGKIDLVYPVGTTSFTGYNYVSLVPTVSGWSFGAATSVSGGGLVHGDPSWVSVLGDLDGDGASDFISFSPGSTSSNLYTSRLAGYTGTLSCPASTNTASCSRYQPRDVVTTFTNGPGRCDHSHVPTAYQQCRLP